VKIIIGVLMIALLPLLIIGIVFWLRYQKKVLNAVLFDAEEKVIISLKKLENLGKNDQEERIQMRQKIKKWEDLEK
jgi:inactivated superfamily I helicase